MGAAFTFLLTLSMTGFQDADPPVIPSLMNALKDPDLETRSYAATALAAFGAPVVDPLMIALKDKDRHARLGAAYALGQLGTTARPAKSLLLATLKDEDKDVRRQAAYALSRLLTAERERPLSTTSPEPVFPPEPTK